MIQHIEADIQNRQQLLENIAKLQETVAALYPGSRLELVTKPTTPTVQLVTVADSNIPGINGIKSESLKRYLVTGQGYGQLRKHEQVQATLIAAGHPLMRHELVKRLRTSGCTITEKTLTFYLHSNPHKVFRRVATSTWTHVALLKK